MQAHRPGSPDVLHACEVPRPRAEPGDVVIAVRAASVNFSDVMRRRGDAYPIPTRFPYTPGSEVAGIVEEVGAGVDPALVGRRVFALAAHDASGGCAEYALAPVAYAIPIPDGATTFPQSLRALAPFGTCIVYGFASASPLAFDAGDVERFFYKPAPNQTLRAFNLAGYAFGRPEAFGAALARLIGMVARGEVSIDVTALPLHEAAHAHRLLESRAALGKLVLLT